MILKYLLIGIMLIVLGLGGSYWSVLKYLKKHPIITSKKNFIFSLLYEVLIGGPTIIGILVALIGIAFIGSGMKWW